MFFSNHFSFLSGFSFSFFFLLSVYTSKKEKAKCRDSFVYFIYQSQHLKLINHVHRIEICWNH